MALRVRIYIEKYIILKCFKIIKVKIFFLKKKVEKSYSKTFKIYIIMKQF